MSDVYTHGHHESVLRSHASRTAENSAAYLLGSLRAGLSLLDVGCGPGTITVDLAERVAPGRVVGIDREPTVLAQADALRLERGADNVAFRAGDAYGLDFPDATFDVVHVHQVLQHLTNPVAALAEMRRVLRPGGILAVREADYGAFAWAPADPRLERWMSLYHAITRRNGAEADAGRHLPGWVRQAGFTDLVVSSSAWTFADPDSRSWWGSVWADRVRLSRFAEQAIAYGLAGGDELDAIADGWREWAEQPDGVFVALSVEVLAHRAT